MATAAAQGATVVVDGRGLKVKTHEDCPAPPSSTTSPPHGRLRGGAPGTLEDDEVAFCSLIEDASARAFGTYDPAATCSDVRCTGGFCCLHQRRTSSPASTRPLAVDCSRSPGGLRESPPRASRVKTSARPAVYVASSRAARGQDDGMSRRSRRCGLHLVRAGFGRKKVRQSSATTLSGGGAFIRRVCFLCDLGHARDGNWRARLDVPAFCGQSRGLRISWAQACVPSVTGLHGTQ